MVRFSGDYNLPSHLMTGLVVWIFIAFLITLISTKPDSYMRSLPTYEEHLYESREKTKQKQLEQEKENKRLNSNSSEYRMVCGQCLSNLKKKYEYCPYCGITL